MTTAFIIGAIAFIALCGITAWLITRGGSDDYEPIENGGDDE